MDDQPIAETSAATRRRPLVLAGIMLGMFMSAVESTIVASAMPTIVARLGGVWGIAAIIGPALGAFIVQHLSWSIIFWINLPVGVASIALLALYFREHLVPHEHTIDYGGSALLMVGSGALMLALTQAHELGATMFWGLVVAAAATVGRFLLPRVARRAPLLP